MQAISDETLCPRYLSVVEAVAKGTVRISRRNYNIKISPEKGISWVTALKDTAELL